MNQLSVTFTGSMVCGLRDDKVSLKYVTTLETDPKLVEEAVRYIIFLVDADKLFDIALGMYDFSLVLLVAQHSQRVREYY